MPTNFPQAIVQSGSIRQTGTLPAAMAQAEKPKPSATLLDEKLKGGQEVPPWVVILTALPEEFLAVENHLTDRYEDTHEDGTVYRCGCFESDNSVWNVAIVETGQGNVNAADQAQRAMSYCYFKPKPEVLFFVGVAGGRKEVAIGDVVASDKVYNYESGRDEVVFRPRPEVGHASYSLEQRARAVVRAWLRRREEAGNENLPRAFVGAIASGESVVASTESGTAKLLQKNYGDALAVEKEGYGFLEAARRSQSVKAIVIRGISDLLDEKEAADQAGSQKLAAHNASAFAFEMLAQLRGKSTSSSSANADQAGVQQSGILKDETVQIPLERQFPKDVAVLYVEKEEGKLSLKAFNAEQDSLEPLETGPPPPLLPDELKSGQQIGEFLGRLAAYRPRQCAMGRFLGWLLTLRKMLREAFNSELSRLIINDRTNFEIPWEMLNLPGNETLGTVVQTVRWHDIDDPETWDPVPLPRPAPKRHYCRGKTLLLTSAEELSKAHCGTQLWQAYQFVHLADLEAFFSRLKQAPSEFGLLFIASREFQRLSKENLEAPLHNYTNAIKSSPRVAFIDVQLLPDEQPAMSYRDLATLFLQYGLKGVVGTLKTLNDREATQIVQSFFAELAQDREREATIPEILRRLRVKAAQQLRQDFFNEETRLLYLSTCLYAYSGNQMTVLALTPAEDTSHD
jgi:nucleoside phosphorylase